MPEARPGGPQQRTAEAMEKARAHPGHWVPLVKTHTHQLQAYYTTRYPEFDFMYRQGELFLRWRESQS